MSELRFRVFFIVYQFLRVMLPNLPVCRNSCTSSYLLCWARFSGATSLFILSMREVSPMDLRYSQYFLTMGPTQVLNLCSLILFSNIFMAYFDAYSLQNSSKRNSSPIFFSSPLAIQYALPNMCSASSRQPQQAFIYAMLSQSYALFLQLQDSSAYQRSACSQSPIWWYRWKSLQAAWSQYGRAWRHCWAMRRHLIGLGAKSDRQVVQILESRALLQAQGSDTEDFMCDSSIFYLFLSLSISPCNISSAFPISSILLSAIAILHLILVSSLQLIFLKLPQNFSISLMASLYQPILSSAYTLYRQTCLQYFSLTLCLPYYILVQNYSMLRMDQAYLPQQYSRQQCRASRLIMYYLVFYFQVLLSLDMMRIALAWNSLAWEYSLALYLNSHCRYLTYTQCSGTPPYSMPGVRSSSRHTQRASPSKHSSALPQQNSLMAYFQIFSSFFTNTSFMVSFQSSLILMVACIYSRGRVREPSSIVLLPKSACGESSLSEDLRVDMGSSLVIMILQGPLFDGLQLFRNWKYMGASQPPKNSTVETVQVQKQDPVAPIVEIEELDAGRRKFAEEIQLNHQQVLEARRKTIEMRPAEQHDRKKQVMPKKKSLPPLVSQRKSLADISIKNIVPDSGETDEEPEAGSRKQKPASRQQKQPQLLAQQLNQNPTPFDPQRQQSKNPSSKMVFEQLDAETVQDQNIKHDRAVVPQRSKKLKPQKVI